MHEYKILIDPKALRDIQDATDWYNEQLKSLGSRFQKQVKIQISSLVTNPGVYSIRYNKVRCMPIRRFPFLVHFSLDQNRMIVEIVAVLHTSRNPKI